MNSRFHVPLTLGLVALLCAGCSISQSITDSVTSPFRWSSDTVGYTAGEPSYRRDLSDYAASFARSGGDLDAFRTAVRQRAEAQGISNWQEDPLTCASIGYGLQVAELDRAQVDRLADELLGGHPKGLEALYEGYATVP